MFLQMIESNRIRYESMLHYSLILKLHYVQIFDNDSVRQLVIVKNLE